MTVLRTNPAKEYTAPGWGYPFAGSGLQGSRVVPASRQVQNWTRGMEISTGRQRSVINEKQNTLPAFSAKGIRWDVLTVALSLILLLFVCILAADIGALFSGGGRIDRLSAGIESLEGTNAILRQELSAAMNHPVLRNMAGSSEPLNERVVVLSPAPEK